MKGQVLVIACGAIARELVRIRDVNGWDHLQIQSLPAAKAMSLAPVGVLIVDTSIGPAGSSTSKVYSSPQPL